MSAVSANSRSELEGWGKEARDPLELIARMLVGGSYRVPVEGRSTAMPLASADIAGAVAYMGDPLQREAAVAVALRAGDVQVAQVSLLAYGKVAAGVRAMSPATLDLRDAADRWRLRLVIYDAVHDLVWPERRGTVAERAKVSKMRKQVYGAVHRVATAALQEVLSEARRSFRAKLFGR